MTFTDLSKPIRNFTDNQPHAPNMTQLTVAELTTKLQAAWAAADHKPHFNRWVLDSQAVDGRPKREKDLKERTKRGEEDQLGQDLETGAWMLRRNEKILPIVTVDKLCQIVAEKYVLLGSKGKVESVLEAEYAGVIRQDIRLLLKGIGSGEVCAALPTIPESRVSSSAAGPSEQQEDIFNCESLRALEAEWEKQKEMYPRSHIANLAEVGMQVLNAGHAARPYIPSGSLNGSSKWSYDEADYLLFTEDEYTQWLKEEHPPRVVVIRDRLARSRKAIPSTEEYLNELASMGKSQIDVQCFDTSEKKLAVKLMSGEEVQAQWNNRNENSPPMNLLNLVDYSTGILPDAFGALKRCMLLSKACQLSDTKVFGSIRAVQPKVVGPPDSQGPGKKPAERYTMTDIKNCQRFRIMAQRGSISGWHADVMGNITYVRVAGRFPEGSLNTLSEKDTDSVKLWPFFPMDKLSSQEQELAEKEFARMGPNWKPKPNSGIPVLALVRGDTLIMPPGTIHAPITLTDVSMAGGMCMDERQLQQHIKWWHFLSKYKDCTNERRPKQTYAVLSLIKKWVHQNPGQYKMDNKELLDQFDKLTDEICGDAIHCTCDGECNDCNCARWEVPCGVKCHRKRGSCPNSIGKSKWT